MIIFTPQNLVLLIAGLINLVMSIIVFSRGVKNKINLYFGLLTFFNFTWSLGLLLSRSVLDISIVSLYARSTYISAIGIVIFLFYFCLHFPYQAHRLDFKKLLIIWFPGLLLSFVIYTKLFILETVRAYSQYEYISYYYKPVFFIYAFYFLLMAIWSMRLLFSKYQSSEGLIKKQLKLLMFAIIIGLVLGSYFDLFIEYFENYHFNWLGPIFTAFMNIVVFHFITSSKDKIKN